jgi:hypothetical protein
LARKLLNIRSKTGLPDRFSLFEGDMNDNRKDVLDLGTWLGRRQALSAVAGRCSAADAECLREIRQGKRYRALKLSWQEFCRRHLGISRVAADRIIRHLEEFGPAYFQLAAITRVTPEDYRRIRGAVTEDGLAHEGRVLALIPENTAQVTEAVEALRAAAAPPRRDEITRARLALWDVIDRFKKLDAQPLDEGGRLRLRTAVGDGIDRLGYLARFLRP